MSTDFTPPADQQPFGQRVLAGVIGGALVFGVAQLMALAIPESGSTLLRAWLQYGGMGAACIAAIYAALDAPR